MLQTIHIRDFALIERLELDFDSGLNVLTGETGAGKSILIGALNLVLGARASSDSVRTGAKSARIDGVFRVAAPTQQLLGLLEARGIELENGELMLSRTISADGRSKAYVNGDLVPASVQAAIGEELVDLHGQHEHQSLLKRDRQLALIDAFGGSDAARRTVAKRVAELTEVTAAFDRLEGEDRESARRIDFLKFEADEIEKASLAPGEFEELNARRNIIVNAEKIFSLLGSLNALLIESDVHTPALDLVNDAARNLEELAEIDPRFAPMSEQLESVRNELDAIGRELSANSDGVEFDPNELDSLNARISQIRELERKYGNSVDEILGYRDTILQEISDYENRDTRLAELAARRDEVRADAMREAARVSKMRKKAATRLDAAVRKGLQDLGMAGAVFDTDLQPVDLNATGIDRAEFLLCANPGERPKPLRHVASGGEISRIMLAIKAVFADVDTIPTLVFDEIDAGIGGAVAGMVAAKLSRLSGARQTICITHLPQIAAAADAHYRVEKAAANARTITTVRRIDDEARISEVARLLDGSLTPVSLDHARAMLDDRKKAS